MSRRHLDKLAIRVSDEQVAVLQLLYEVEGWAVIEPVAALDAILRAEQARSCPVPRIGRDVDRLVAGEGLRLVRRHQSSPSVMRITKDCAAGQWSTSTATAVPPWLKTISPSTCKMSAASAYSSRRLCGSSSLWACSVRKSTR